MEPRTKRSRCKEVPMKSLVLVVVLLAGSYARGDDCRNVHHGQGRFRARWRKSLGLRGRGSGLVPPSRGLRQIRPHPSARPSGKAAQRAGPIGPRPRRREVDRGTAVHHRRDTSEVLVGGLSINDQMARILRSEDLDRPPSSPSEGQPRRPLVALCQALRILPAWTLRSRPYLH